MILLPRSLLFLQVPFPDAAGIDLARAQELHVPEDQLVLRRDIGLSPLLKDNDDLLHLLDTEELPGQLLLGGVLLNVEIGNLDSSFPTLSFL